MCLNVSIIFSGDVSAVPSIANAVTWDTSTDFLSTVRYTCEPGYLIGESLSDDWFVLQCNALARWELMLGPVVNTTTVPIECRRKQNMRLSFLCVNYAICSLSCSYA